MNPNSDQYNTAAIRNLLRDAFTAQDLWRFCQERPNFQPVLVQFPYNPSPAQMIDVLTQYCQTQLLFDELLLAVREANPRQYERYQAQLYSDSTGPLPVLQIPHNLPPRSEFVGREAEKARIYDALRSRAYLISIDGIGGIGKTSLALEVAYECLHASQSDAPYEEIVTFDSIVWTTAKDRDLTLNALLDAVAQTLDYPGIVQRPLEQKRLAVQKLLQEKPCLLIVDNFETVADEDTSAFLLRLPEPSKALLTTRRQKLAQVWAISLKGLTESEALELIRSEGRCLGLTSIEQAEDRVLLHLHEATGGAPLALKWSVGQIKQRGQSLDTVLAALHEARGSIFEDIFARSWSLLAVDARQVLKVMPLFATSAARAAIETASDVHHFALDDALGQLVEMLLVDATDDLDSTQRRYSIHPLTRSFARMQTDQGPDSQEAARLRLATYYGKRCSEMGQWGHTAGFPWLEAELPNIVVVIEWANRTQRFDVIISIFKSLVYFLDARGYSQERIRLGQMALEAARQVGDISAIADCESAIAWTLLRRRRQYEESEKLFRSCLSLRLDIGKEREAVWTMINLANAAIGKGDLDKARAVIDDAASLARKTGFEPHGLRSTQGRIEFELGNLQSARRHFLAALELSQIQESATSLVSIGSRQVDLGNIALTENKLGEAASYFEAGLDSGQRASHLTTTARASFGLAKVHTLSGNKREAVRLARSAREGFARMCMEREVGEAIALLRQLKDTKE